MYKRQDLLKIKKQNHTKERMFKKDTKVNFTKVKKQKKKFTKVK